MAVTQYELPESLGDDSRFTPALLGARDLLGSLEVPQSHLSRVERALDLMFEVHHDQTRPGGSPYVDHTVLVPRIFVKRFGIHDPDGVVAAILHDAPEDQAARVIEKLTGEESTDPLAAIDALASAFGADPDKVKSYLRLLTNPDFDQAVRSLREEVVSSREIYDEANSLLELAQKASGEARDVSSYSTDRELKNALYLGHIVEIAESGNQIAFAIKLADFFCNGLHFHLFRQKVDEMSPGTEREKLEAKATRLSEKYEPVVDYLTALFESVTETTGETIISGRVDAYLLSKLKSVKEFGYS